MRPLSPRHGVEVAQERWAAADRTQTPSLVVDALGIADRRADRAAVPPLSTSVFELISAEGFGGSYPSVVRGVRDLRGPASALPPGSVPIETAPGEERQFDFSDCSARGQAWPL